MKKKSSTSQSAPARRSLGEGGFFNLRVLLGVTLSFLGLALAIFAGKDIALRNLQGPTRTDVLAGRSGETARYMPVPGRNVREEASGLARLEQYWNDRLTFPTGRFNPAWVRAAARQHAGMPSGVPFGQRMNLDLANPNALSTTSFTALGPQPERMTGCQGCFNYTTTQGRVNAIVVDPTTTINGSIVAYLGAIGGGVWKTTNCCSDMTTWSVVTDDPLIGTTAIDAMEMDPNNHNTIYAGTGDLNYGSFSMGSQGILKSIDAGATWTVLGADVFGPSYDEPPGQFPQYNAVGKVRVDPNNSSNVVAGTKKGLYISYDGGVNWTGPCTTNGFSTQRQDITGLELTDMGAGVTRIIAAVGVRGFATTVQYDLGANGANGIYKGTMPISGCPSDFSLISRDDNGFVFGTQVTGSAYATGAPMHAGSGTPYAVATPSPAPSPVGNQLGRIDIAVAPSNPNYIYAQVQSIAFNSNNGCGNTNGCQIGVWSSTNGGDSWAFMAGSAGGSLRNCTNGQGDYPQNWYDQAVAVDPNNPDRVFISTFDVWFATRTGTTFNDTTCGYSYSGSAGPVHVDQHALAFLPGSSSILAIGNDGGIHGTINANVVSSTVDPTWFNMDTGLNTIEFYSGDISGNFANAPAPMAVGGSQDNGPSSVTFAGTPTGPVLWQLGLGGDGFSGQIDPRGTGTTQAQGTITVSGVGTVGRTFVIGAQTFTWVMTRSGAGQVSAGTSTNTAATNIRNAVNADIPATATASGSGGTVIITATVGGSSGNSIPFLNNNSPNLTFNGSGTLGGTRQGNDNVGSLRVWQGNNSGGLSRCTYNCTAPGATWVSENPTGTWSGDLQSFILPINLFHGGIPGGDDCPPAASNGGCGHLIVGTTRVWETITGNTPSETTRAVTWYVTNNPTNQNMTKGTLGNRSFINQVKYSPKYQSVAIVGTNDANVWIGFNLGTGTASQANWVDVTGSNIVLPLRPVLGVALDPRVPAVDVPVGYAAVGGFNANTPTQPGHIFQVSCASNCSSFTWANKTGNLPDIPVDSIIVNPNIPQQVFAGTDFGVYYTDDVTVADPIWNRFDNGVPHVMIWDMAIDRGGTTLSVWTRGRGAYVYPLSGLSFVIGDLNAVVGQHVTFWGGKWAKSNRLSGGPAPSAFKGFAENTTPNPAFCGGTWTSGAGGSSGPPATLPSTIRVIVASSITKSGPVISGNIPQMAVINVDPGYQPDPDHPGTGTVISVDCP